jgi:hypothetical protein
MNRSFFSALDPTPPSTYKDPPIKCGDYTSTVAGEMFATYGYSFRRMPRKKNYEGKFGLFWHSKDEGKVLIAVWSFEKGIFERTDKIKEHDLPVNTWRDGSHVLTEHACAWCGRKLDDPDADLHPNCEKKTK